MALTKSRSYSKGAMNWFYPLHKFYSLTGTMCLVCAGRGGGAKRIRRTMRPATWIGKRRVAFRCRKRKTRKLSLCRWICRYLLRFWSLCCLFLRIFLPCTTSICVHSEGLQPPLDSSQVLLGSLAHTLRGGAGGASATKRKQAERLLLEGLTELLNKCNVDETQSQNAPVIPDQHTSYRDDSWVEVAKRGKKSKHDSPKDLFSDLVTLVNTCKNGNTTGLLEKLRALVAQYSTPARDLPSDRRVTFAPKATQARDMPSDRRVTFAPKTSVKHDSRPPVVGPREKKPAESVPLKRPPKLSPIIADRFCNYHVLNEKLNEGLLPEREFALVKASNVPELRQIAAMHDIKTPYALVVWDTVHDTPKPCDRCEKRWLSTSSGAVHVRFSPLLHDLPDLPSQPVIHESKAPDSEELVPIRITAYQMHQPAKWKDFRKDPVKHFANILPPGLHMRTYGWREILTDDQTAILGYAKIPASKTDEILALAGKGGWLLEPLRCHAADRKPVAWVAKQPNEAPDVYFCRVLALCTQKKLPWPVAEGVDQISDCEVIPLMQMLSANGLPPVSLLTGSLPLSPSGLLHKSGKMFSM